MESLFVLDRSDPVPLHQQLRSALEAAIVRGAFPLGRPLPSSRSLAERMGVSRNTVNSAYDDLLAQGFIEALPRRGFFVSPEFRASLEASPRSRRTVPADWAARLAPEQPDFQEIRKNAEWDRYPYPFLSGQPDLRVFPVVEWGRMLREALRPHHLTAALADAQWRDDALLVDMVCQHVLPQRGIDAGPDNVMITLGSQHALALVAQALVRPGTRVGLEDPGYVDARNIFLLAGAQVVPIPVDEAGVCVDADMAALDLLYLTPSHHYPTNVTLAAGRRKQILSLAREHGVAVVEDDYDTEFRYQGSLTPALKAIDAGGHVIYVGSFSKLVAPGVRLGFVVGAPTLIEHLRLRSRYMVRHPPGHLQRAMALFIESGSYGRHVRRLRKHYKRKWELCVEAVERHFSWREHSFPPGGMSLWVTGPDDLDAEALAVGAQTRGVLIEPGRVCYLAAPLPTNRFKLGFAAIDQDAIEQGVAILAEEIRRSR